MLTSRGHGTHPIEGAGHNIRMFRVAAAVDSCSTERLRSADRTKRQTHTRAPTEGTCSLPDSPRCYTRCTPDIMNVLPELKNRHRFCSAALHRAVARHKFPAQQHKEPSARQPARPTLHKVYHGPRKILRKFCIFLPGTHSDFSCLHVLCKHTCIRRTPP